MVLMEQLCPSIDRAISLLKDELIAMKLSNEDLSQEVSQLKKTNEKLKIDNDHMDRILRRQDEKHIAQLKLILELRNDLDAAHVRLSAAAKRGRGGAAEEGRGAAAEGDRGAVDKVPFVMPHPNAIVGWVFVNSAKKNTFVCRYGPNCTDTTCSKRILIHQKECANGTKCMHNFRDDCAYFHTPLSKKGGGSL